MHRGNGEKWIVVRVLPPRMAWPAAAKYSALRGLALAYRSSASRTAEARSWFTRKTVVAMRDTCAENRVARWGVSQFWGLRGGVWQDANRRSSALITKGSLRYRAYPAKANSPDRVERGVRCRMIAGGSQPPLFAFVRRRGDCGAASRQS